MASILVVEDEQAMAKGIVDLLAFHGHQPQLEQRGDTGLERAIDGAFDLLVLDVMLPGMSGFDVCRKVRAKFPGQAILLLTALGQEQHVLEGFAAGCDDYLSKPFSMAIFVARVSALLRRGIEEDGIDPSTTRTRELALGFDFRELRLGDAEYAVELSVREAETLRYFLSRTGLTCSRVELLSAVWNYPNPNNLETRCVDMHVAKLRTKLRAARVGFELATVRGVGYRLNLEQP